MVHTIIKFFADHKNDFMVFFITFFTLLHLPIFAKPITFSDTTKVILPFIQHCSISNIPELRDPFRFYSLCFSNHVLGNTYWLPSIGMISLIIITYFLAKQFTNSHQYSLLAILLLTLTNSFSMYAFSATYDQTWVALLFGSLLLLNTRYRSLAIIPFIVSLGFRGLPLLDLPIIFSYILILDLDKKKKIKLIIPFIIVGVISIVYTLEGGYALSQNAQIIMNWQNGLEALQSFRMDLVAYAFAVPLGFMLFKAKSKTSAFILFSIVYLVFQTYCLSTFTNLGQQPYRMFPLLIFIMLGYSYIIKRIFSRVEIYQTH